MNRLPEPNGHRLPSLAWLDLDFTLQLPRPRTSSTDSLYGLLGEEGLPLLTRDRDQDCITVDPGLSTMQDEELWPLHLSLTDNDNLVSWEHTVLASSSLSTDLEDSFIIDTSAPVLHVSQSDDLDYPNRELSSISPTSSSSYVTVRSPPLLSVPPRALLLPPPPVHHGSARSTAGRRTITRLAALSNTIS